MALPKDLKHLITLTKACKMVGVNPVNGGRLIKKGLLKIGYRHPLINRVWITPESIEATLKYCRESRLLSEEKGA